MVNKHWLVLICAGVIMAGATGCVRQQSGATELVEIQGDTVDYFRSLGLEPYWSYDLQMGPTETIKKVWLEPQSIYCLTSKNWLHCLDRSTGATRWIRQPAKPPRVVHRPVEADGKTLVVAHNIAKVYETQTARPIGQVQLAFAPNSDPAFDGEVLYIANSLDRLVAIELQRGREIWNFRAEKSISARPVRQGVTLIAASESGEVMAYVTRFRDPLWTDYFRTRGAILSPVVLTAQGRCYVLGGDSMLYCLNSGSGDEIWRYFAQVPLPKEPTVVDGRVFLNVPGRGLVVLDAGSGVELEGFGHPQGQGYLGRVNDKLYIVTADRRIVSLDANSGQQLAQLEVKNFNIFLSNDKAGRLYLADRLGRIVCLQGLARTSGQSQANGE